MSRAHLREIMNRILKDPSKSVTVTTSYIRSQGLQGEYLSDEWMNDDWMNEEIDRYMEEIQWSDTQAKLRDFLKKKEITEDVDLILEKYHDRNGIDFISDDEEFILDEVQNYQVQIEDMKMLKGRLERILKKPPNESLIQNFVDSYGVDALPTESKVIKKCLQDWNIIV